MNHDHSTFEDLCSGLLDGQLGDADRARLTEMVENDPALREELRQQLLISGALARQNPQYSDERFEASVSNHLRSLGEESTEAFPGKIRTLILSHRRKRQLGVALAACLALSVLGLSLFWSQNTSTPAAVAVAQATLLPDLVSVQSRSEAVTAGRQFDLRGGLMRLEFENGAVVAIEAPARFTVTSGDEILLESGKLNAWCPESAHGFRVNTRSATLTDLGTSFGISAAPDGSADFFVLDGEVEVASGDELRRLHKGNAVRATQENALRDLAFEPSPFTRTWPVASGIQSTSGQVIPAPPNTPEAVALHEDDHHIIAIPERRSLRLPQRLPVDIASPGNYRGNQAHSPRGAISKPGTRARSYLLRYNPVGVVELDQFKRFEGSVTFDRPVLGIITSTTKLRWTDALASAAPLPRTVEDPSMRGLEQQPPNPPDEVTLSPDLKTVSVVFYAGESVDEIRVIVAEEE